MAKKQQQTEVFRRQSRKASWVESVKVAIPIFPSPSGRPTPLKSIRVTFAPVVGTIFYQWSWLARPYSFFARNSDTFWCSGKCEFVVISVERKWCFRVCIQPRLLWWKKSGSLPTNNQHPAAEAKKEGSDSCWLGKFCVWHLPAFFYGPASAGEGKNEEKRKISGRGRFCVLKQRPMVAHGLPLRNPEVTGSVLVSSLCVWFFGGFEAAGIWRSNAVRLM